MNMEINRKYPCVLIVSRNALKLSGSNGKVMAEMFGNWDKECLAQIYTHNELPEFEGCGRYFRVTDKEAIKALLPWKRVGCEVSNAQPSVKEGVSKTGNVVRKNPLTLLLQDMVWNTGCWKSKELKRWIDDFKPEVLFFMAGSSSFMAKFAIDVAMHKRIPLVVFNTENYYLKNYNYLERYGWKRVFPLLKWENDRMFERLMQTSSHEIYNNGLLDELYAERFGRHGTVIYQGSSLKPFERKVCDKKSMIFTYAGNLGINRHQALIQIGQALQSISASYYLDVYGKATDDVSQQLNQAEGIRYHGFISYDELVVRMKESDFMVHAESFDEFWVKDLQAAFSTKLSDILATGSCLILYADKSLACSRYVEENKCGCLISSPQTLAKQLKELINDETLQEQYRKNALIAAKRDLDADKNREAFFNIIEKVCINSK